MNFHAVRSIYFFEMHRWARTLVQSIAAPVITTSLYERFQSRQLGEFTDQICSAMRSEFGGHAEKKS